VTCARVSIEIKHIIRVCRGENQREIFSLNKDSFHKLPTINVDVICCYFN
jgi:hypothetical protein